MDDKRYKLRSGRQQVTVPTELQLVGDDKFVSQMTGSNHPTSGQVIFSDNQLSTSDLDKDVDEVVHHVDQIFLPHVFQACPVNMPGLLNKARFPTYRIWLVLAIEKVLDSTRKQMITQR